MQTLYPPPKDEDVDTPGDDGDGDDDDILSRELKNHFSTVRSLVSSGNNQQEAQTMATKTAIVAEEEIRRLQNGIAELEALLAQQQQHQQEEQLPPPPLPAVVAFPSLPPVVVEEEEEPGKGELVS